MGSSSSYVLLLGLFLLLAPLEGVLSRRFRDEPESTVSPEEAQLEAKAAAEKEAELVREGAEADTKMQMIADTTQAKQQVDAAGLSAESQAKAMAQAKAQDEAAGIKGRIDAKFQVAEQETEAQAGRALETLASNANTKAKAMAASRLESAVKDAKVEEENLHESSEKLEEAASTSQKTTEQAAHFAVNAAKTAIDAVDTMAQWTPQKAMQDAVAGNNAVHAAEKELGQSQTVADMASTHSTETKNSAASSKTMSQRARMEAEAALKQTQKGQAGVEEMRQMIEMAKIQATEALSEARNAVWKAGNAAKKVGVGGAFLLAREVKPRNSLF